MDYGAQLQATNPIAHAVIDKAMSQDRAVQTYLFSAPRDYAIEYEPLYLMARLTNNPAAFSPLNYPDLVVIDGQTTGVSKDEVLLAMERMNQSALGAAQVKILYIKNIERGNVASLSALLKFLEEPAPHTYVILTTNHLADVLPTIKSRAQVITLRGMPRRLLTSALVQTGLKEGEAKLVSALTGSMNKALVLAQDAELTATYKTLLRQLEAMLRQPLKTYSELGPSLTKERCDIIAHLLLAFVNDTWRVAAGMAPLLENAKVLTSKYAQSVFDYAGALAAVNELLVATASTRNFDIARTAFLIAWERCYG